MRKCACSLALLCLTSILGIVFSNPSNTQHEKTLLQSLQLTHAQANALCTTITKSQIESKQAYQWVRVQKQPSEKSQLVKQQELQTEKNNGSCFKIGFKSCIGTPRFPFEKDCGFYTLVLDDECSSSSVRSKRSISTGHVSLNHGEASHLCHTIQTPFPNSPEQINYVALKVQLPDSEPTPHAPENCINWVYTPCMPGKQEDCRGWHKIVKSTEECSGFQSTDPADHPTQLETSSLNSTLRHEISSSSLPETEQVIQCKTIGSDSAIQCEIVPFGTQLELSTEDRHSRQKRHYGCIHYCCCHHYRCDCCCGYSDYLMSSCGLCCPIWMCNGQGKK